jgi:hypothetical protein
MTPDQLNEACPELMRMEPQEVYDSCIVGVIERAGGEQCLCYDAYKVVAKLVANGMADEDAWEFFAYNVVSAYLGKHTPAFLYSFEAENEA